MSFTAGQGPTSSGPAMATTPCPAARGRISCRARAGSIRRATPRPPGGVFVRLWSGEGLSGEAAGDILTGIENLRGSAFADTLVGDGGANVLSGGAGEDQLLGRGG